MGLLQSLAQKTRRLSASYTPDRLRRRRRAHLYCVGTAKSGTSSLAALFGDALHARHETDSEHGIDTILRRQAGALSDSELRRYLLRRDRRLRLEIDSSQLNVFFLDALVELFPDARFLLTLRDPYSWVDSFINHQMGRSAPHKWPLLRDLRFRPDTFTHPREEALLAEKGLYTLDGYFSYWASHNRTVLDTVPAERLLVVRTHEISERTSDIAAFAGVPAAAANRQRSHANKAKRRYHLLRDVSVDHLHQRATAHCRALMQQYFPHVAEPQDALAYLPPLTEAARP